MLTRLFRGPAARLVRALALATSTPLLCLLLSLPLSAAPQPPAASKQFAIKTCSIYALDISNTKQAFTVTLNGWFIDTNPGSPNGYFSSQLVGDYIADGQNTVTIHVKAPAHGKPPLDPFRVHIRSSDGEVFSYDWEPDDPKHPLPVQAEGHFQAHLPTGPWAWQTAPKITLHAPTKAAINAFVKRLFDALNAKNVEEATALFAPRARDNYLTRNLTIAEADADNRRDWVTTFTEPHWRMEPIDYARLNYTLAADGRAVQVARADDSYVLRGAVPDAKGLVDRYDISLCLVKGQWTLIR